MPSAGRQDIGWRLIHPSAGRDCPKRGSSNASAVNSADIRTPDGPNNSSLDGPKDLAIDALGTFRTVSEEEFSEV
jgi:hypothetical protein